VADFNAAAVRFGKPGKLYMGLTLLAVEPTAVNTAWSADWIPMGYTSEGSAFNYSISTDNVDVAEELDVLARVTTGRDASVEFALAEITKRNLNIAFNGGVVLGDGAAWSFEPPDLGAETRVIIGWDASPDPLTNDLRIIFRQCLQGGSLGLENRKGSAKSTIATQFQLEKPATGKKLLKIMGGAVLNPDDTP
jgi:hypothetical protein